MSNFKVIKVAGEGNYSKIYQCREKSTGKIFAIKEYIKPQVKRVNKLDDVKMEKHTLGILKDCKWVTKIYETF